MDLRWTWSHASDALWRAIDAHAWEHTQNPYLILQNVSQQRLALEREQYITQESWYSRNCDGMSQKRIAYFSMKFGLGQALPLYAGGLGILAGDYLKIASDLGVPLIAIGLLYQEGYFRQILDNNGWQLEIYPYNDPTSLPITPVRTASGEWLYVTSNFPGRTIRFRVWQAQVGRVTLYLLDS